MLQQFASLPMYDLPQLRPHTDALWRQIASRMRDHGIAGVPSELAREGDPHRDWLREDLLLSQTCGLPFVRELQGRVHLLGTPSYDIDCGSGGYYSVLIARAGQSGGLPDVSSGWLACNDLRSQSGYAALVTHLRQEGLELPGAMVFSGSHMQSIEMVANGEADFAAIDAVTWALARRHTDVADGVREIGRTAPTPGLPYITSLSNRPDSDILRQAISEAIAGLAEVDRAALLLTGFVGRQSEDYEPIADAWREIEAAGFGTGFGKSASGSEQG